jgi:hypothetical protein
MNGKIRRFHNKNLKMPESGVNFMLLRFLNKIDNMVYFINPVKYDTNANIPILDTFDHDSETRGKITFLPIEFLEKIYKETSENSHIEFNSRLTKKKFLLDYLKAYLNRKNISVSKFLKSSSFNGVPLIYFRKSFLKSDFSQTKDFSRFHTINDDLDINIGYSLGYNTRSRIYPQKHNKSAWLSSGDIYNCIYPLTLINNNYDYFHLLLFTKADVNMGIVYSSMHKTNLDDRLQIYLKSDKRFFIFPIIYNDHFTCCVIDKQCEFKNSIGKVVYFFNSSGYIPEYIKLNKKFLFIETDMTVNSHTKYKSNNTHLIYTYIDILSDYLNKSLNGVNKFIFNTYEIQYDSPDCGMFNIIFLYYLIYFNIKTLFDFKKLYYSMSFIGDLLASSYRGALFISIYDINTLEGYKNNLDIFKIKNKKFIELKDMYEKNNRRILEICKDIGNENITEA